MTNEGSILFRANRFDDAVAAFQRQLSDGAGDRLVNTAGLAESLMAVGRYSEAAPLFAEVGALEKRGLSGSLGRDTEVSICDWLSGDRDGGMALMRSIVEGLQSGAITYANDRVGGLKHGLLLHYMSVTLDSSSDIHLSMDFIKKLSQSKKAKNWPGPIGNFLSGNVVLDDVLEAGIGVRDIERASQQALSDLMVRRKLTNILFNAAVASRVSKNEDECIYYMRRCSDLPNPLIEFDWHLARAEVLGASC